MKADELLAKENLSKTQVRTEIINLLKQRNYALSEQEIKDRLFRKYNRTTIYRTLKTFLEHNIIHQIVDDKSVARYVINKEYIRKRNFYKEHLHFKCKACGRLFCLENTPVKQYNLPEGFTFEKSEFLVIGICRDCNRNL